MPAPFISEVKYLGAGNIDFVEVAVDAGTDVSNIQIVIYNPSGSVRTTNALGTLDNTEAGRDIYVIDAATSATFNGLHANGAAALVVNGVVTQFISFNQAVTATNGPAAGPPPLTSTQIGTTGTGESLETDDFGSSYSVQTTPNPGNVPCFLAGTLIRTDRGERPVETLRAGDLVLTADDGYQPVIWAGCRTLSPSEHHDPMKSPVRIPAGALAAGVPARDLYVSANHRIALAHPLAEMYFHADEVLAAAKHLCGHRQVTPTMARAPIVYHHILLARHQVIWSNGAPTESFHPAQVGLEAFDTVARAQILRAIGSVGRYGPTARKVLKADEAALLLKLTADSPVAIEATETKRRAA